MADIISFPSHRTNIGPASLAGPIPPQPNAQLLANAKPQKLAQPSTDDVIVRAMAICASTPPAPLCDVPDSAWVIRTGMRWIARRGRRRESLPRMALALLDRHVAVNDPAAVMFNDWLEQRLPPGVAARDVPTATEPVLSMTTGPNQRGE